MDPQQQMQQTEKIIVEMLEFLESSSEEENDLDHPTSEKCPEDAQITSIKKDFNDNIVTEKLKINTKTGNDSKKYKKPTTAIAKELKKLKQQFPIWNTKEIAKNYKTLPNLHKAPETLDDCLNCKTSASRFDKANVQVDADIPASDYANVEWHNKLEANCRRSTSNSYIQEIHKAIYQDTTGHPPSGSADYYQAAQNYALYGKHFLDFPENLQAVLNDKNSQNTGGAENSNLITNFGNDLYAKPKTATPNAIAAPLTSAAATAATYYQICNSMQAQARPPPALSNNTPRNSTAYGIFLGNKVTYVAGTPTSPSLIYNQHSATTTNFVANSLANAALATSPTILYTNPMLTTTTQQYLNTFFKESQFLSTAALTTNSSQAATVPSNASGAGIYERLLYAQLLQQQIYQTQQAAAVAAMFQHKQRAAVAAATLAAAARQSSTGQNGNVIANTNRASPQHLTTVPSTTASSNGLTLNSCMRQARSSSPSELLRMKQQITPSIPASGNNESSKSSSD
ncbi:uncharacterized protein LOC135951957 [Calliphora vicina]|uniref:uncharacterized protein LOC135951957 n=1 Tax=Calliphora vicina TaxID=7373 RepID=UPI00325A8E82